MTGSNSFCLINSIDCSLAKWNYDKIFMVETFPSQNFLQVSRKTNCVFYGRTHWLFVLKKIISETHIIYISETHWLFVLKKMHSLDKNKKHK
jgi:hypothetical protein